MNILIVASRADLGELWGRHLTRMGAQIDVAVSQDEAVDILHEKAKDIIILELTLEHGAALAVSDFANYRQPNAKVIVVSSARFFTDGSIFHHCSNACAFVPSATAPEDIAAIALHHATH